MDKDSPKFMMLEPMAPDGENFLNGSHQQETTHTDQKTPEKESHEEDDEASTKMATMDNVSPKQDKDLTFTD